MLYRKSTFVIHYLYRIIAIEGTTLLFGLGQTITVLSVEVSSQSRKFEFNVFSIIHFNGHNLNGHNMYWTEFKKIKFCRQHR